jgi:hypothetical protein
VLESSTILIKARAGNHGGEIHRAAPATSIAKA